MSRLEQKKDPGSDDDPFVVDSAHRIDGIPCYRDDRHESQIL